MSRGLDPFQVFIADVARVAPLADDEALDLAPRAQAGDPDAWERLILATQPYLVGLAKRLMGRGLSLPDLVQAGQFGLIGAVGSFPAGPGAHWFGYARTSIVRAIRQAIDCEVPLVSLPLVVHKAVRSGRPLESNMLDRAEAVRTALARQVEPWAEWASGALAMADPGSADEAEAARVRVGELMRALDQREAAVIRQRYGIGCRPSPPARVAGRLRMATERVVQVERLALRKMALAGRGRVSA